MTIPPVTSLADLEFKAKKSVYYKQLAVLGVQRIGYCGIKTYPSAIKRLHRIAVERDGSTCDVVVYDINICCNRIKREENSASKSINKKKAEAIIENLKKFKQVNRKTVKKIKRRVVRNP